MSVQLTPSKRPHDRSIKEPNGKRKWQKSTGSISQNVPLKISPGSAAFRVLCPASKIGGVIGKGGRIISQIRRETGAKVKVEENVRGSDERVIVIMGSDKENEVDSERSNEDAEETNTAEEVDDAKERGEDDEDKQSVPVENLRSDKGTSSVEKALFLVFERIVEGELETDGGDKESDRSSTFVLRLLVLSSQVGCLLGKGGSVIKQMSSESGAQIRILPRDKLPSCASPADELVQVTGAPDAVRKALQSVSQQLLENPPRDNDTFSGNPSGPSSHSHGNPLSRSEVHPPPNYPFPAQGAPYGTVPRNGADYHLTTPPLISKFHESGIPGRVNLSPDILTFRLVCHDEVVGGVIGKGGTIVKSLQHETGCEIKVLDGVSDSEDRIIVISGPAHPDDGVSAPQDAVLRVQSRIFRASSDSKEKPIAKILVSSNQIGCLLGKGGSVIAEMRKSTGAHIRILGKDQLPKSASENEELVQINGEFETVQEALMQITTRLRNHFFRDAFPSINFPSNPSFPDQVSSFPSYMGRREFSPPGMFSNRGLSFHKFDAVGGLPPHGAFHLHDERPFMHNIHGPGFPPHISERTSSAPWGPQGLIEGGGPIGLPDYAGAPQRRIGLGGVSHQAIITNTTVEVVVPRSLVPAIYGEDGGCLQQIREISDAKITITDPNPGATETAIIISGTPEQTHAAQSLIQAFVISEREGA